MTPAKERLKKVADRLTEEDAAKVVGFALWLAGEEGEELAPREYEALDRGIAQARTGRVRPWREIRRTTG